MVLQCISGVSSNHVEGRTKIWQLKNLILTLFGLIFRCIYIYVSITLSASIPNNFVIKIFSLIRMAVRWFPSDTQVSSTNKTDYHNIAKILLQTALKTNKHKPIVFLKKNGLDVTTTDVCRKDIILNAQPMKFLLPITLH